MSRWNMVKAFAGLLLMAAAVVAVAPPRADTGAGAGRPPHGAVPYK